MNELAGARGQRGGDVKPPLGVARRASVINAIATGRDIGAEMARRERLFGIAESCPKMASATRTSRHHAAMWRAQGRRLRQRRSFKSVAILH